MTMYMTSPWQTANLGFKLAKQVLKKGPSKRATVVALAGELGSGKTTFLQGFAKGLGVKEKILSPTFVIFRKLQITNYKLQTNSNDQNSKFQKFYHFDCYRLESGRELYTLNWKEIIKDPKAIVVVEWADRVRSVIPKDALWIEFKWRGKLGREIVINPAPFRARKGVKSG